MKKPKEYHLTQNQVSALTQACNKLLPLEVVGDIECGPEDGYVRHDYQYTPT